jgi:hypothetical protein
MEVVLAIIQILLLAGSTAGFLFWFERSKITKKIATRTYSKILTKAEEEARAQIVTNQQVDPIIAYKRAYVLDTGELAGVGFQDRYKPWDEAKCRKGINHGSVPAVTCTCGFWGLYTAEETGVVGYLPYIALLEVEFFGNVLRLEKGYRAQKQRILSIKFPSTCMGCYVGKAEKLISLKLTSPDSFEWELRDLDKTNPILSQYKNIIVTRSFGLDSPLLPFCPVCVQKFSAFPKEMIQVNEWTPADVANKFQVEANWWNDTPDAYQVLATQLSKPATFMPHLTIYCKNPHTAVTTQHQA